MIDDCCGGRCECEGHSQCCQARLGVLQRNTGTLKPSGGLRIGRSRRSRGTRSLGDFSVFISSMIFALSSFIALISPPKFSFVPEGSPGNGGLIVLSSIRFRSPSLESWNRTGRLTGSVHVDQEDEFASKVELVDASSSRELCVATVTFVPSFRHGSW